VQLQLTDSATLAIRRVHAVVNPISGSVGPGAAEEMRALLAELGLDHRVVELEPGDCEAMVRAAVDAGPDLMVVLGGDGTARTVAEMCGPRGPLVAPLSGGTMNKLGRTLYGARPWREALGEMLQRGVPRWMPGGVVGGRAFYCGAVLGSPALLAPAREAVRAGEIGRAWRKALLASRKAAFSRVAYDLDGDTGEGVAISLLSPGCSHAPGEQRSALKAAVLDPPARAAGPAAGLSLTLRHLIGDWRDDPQLTAPCVSGRAWARKSIPVMLDGEFFRLGRRVEIRYRPRAFRTLTLRAPV
jgi:diacylglycerol kinase family enzyme